MTQQGKDAVAGIEELSGSVTSILGCIAEIVMKMDAEREEALLETARLNCEMIDVRRENQELKSRIDELTVGMPS